MKWTWSADWLCVPGRRGCWSQRDGHSADARPFFKFLQYSDLYRVCGKTLFGKGLNWTTGIRFLSADPVVILFRVNKKKRGQELTNQSLTATQKSQTQLSSSSSFLLLRSSFELQTKKRTKIPHICRIFAYKFSLLDFAFFFLKRKSIFNRCRYAAGRRDVKTKWKCAKWTHKNLLLLLLHLIACSLFFLKKNNF